MNNVHTANEASVRHPRLLRVDEVARALDVSRGYVYRLARDGKLPAVRMGDGQRAPVRIDSDDLARFLEEANA